MRALAAFTVTCAAIAFALAGSAAGGLTVGVNDNAGEDPAFAQWFYPAMGAEGIAVNTIAVLWDETAPTTVPGQAALAGALAAASGNGVTVVFDLFPRHSQVFTGSAPCAPSSDPEGCGDTAEIDQFAAWTALVARAFPTVHQFVVMNECNQPLFVNPQWDSSGANQSAEICGRALAASYDALKGVSSQNFVWGVGLSPRGNDNPAAASNSSTSPVSFLRDLGAWFKAFVQKTGRTRPLMDGLDFHPYPIPQSQPFTQGYPSANDATVSNLPRIYQAFYDGFSGSPQPTIGQQAGGGLPLGLDEVGIQTDSSGRPGYVGSEVSANAAGGVTGPYATEAYQSSWYLQMLDLLACDPNVRIVDIYHLIDEASLAGWQSGLYYLDRTPKASAAAVHDWIAASAGGGACQGAKHPWTPAGVAAIPASPAPTPATGTGPRIVVAANGQLRIFDATTHVLRRVLAPFGDAYAGPLAVALGDVNGDGVADVAVARGPGSPPAAAVLNGKTGQRLASFAPFPASARGGMSVALGDLNGDGKAEVIVGTGPGTAAQVKVFSGATGAVLETLSPFGAAFSGGVSVAAGDVNGDGKADVIVGTGPGAVAQVKVFRDATQSRLWSLQAFSPTFTGGTALATAPMNADRQPDLVLGAGSGGGAQVKVFDATTHTLLASFLGAPGSSAIAVASG